MAFRAGLKPHEFDSLAPQRIWNVIDANYENEKTEWERHRMTWFYVGRFGNSNPKSFPKTSDRFHAFPWEKKTTSKSRAEEIMAQHEKMVERRTQLENKIRNG